MKNSRQERIIAKKRNTMTRFEGKIIGIIGPEGSGKSTITKRLAAETGLPRVYPGDLLREYAKNDTTEIGEAARKMFAENAYFPPYMLLDVMRRRFAQGDLTRGFILDGPFRTVEETRGYPRLLQETQLDMPVTVVSLRIPGWLSLVRLVSGENARAREDDTPQGVIRRLGHFYDMLGFRMKAIRENGWHSLHVRAIGQPEEVYQGVVTALRAEG